MRTLGAKSGMTVSAANKRVLVSVMRSGRELPFRADDGSRPLIVALPNDYLSVILDRVRAAGGAANVAIADMRSFKIVVLRTHDEPVENGGEEYDDDMSMGMFSIRTSSQRGARSFHLSGVRAGMSSATDALAYA